jgi:death on curing protein
MVYLTVDQVLELHDHALTLGGAAGVRSEHLLASAVWQPQHSAFGEDAYPRLAEKAAAYGYFLALNHPFVDGNKRTAELALVTFLDLNGYELVDDEDAIAEMFEDISRGVVEQGEFFGWVCNHARPVDPSNMAEFPKP